MKQDKDYQLAERKIEEARRSGATMLDLYGMKLTALPNALGQLAQLQTLDIGNNRLTALPESLGQLKQLQSLNLSDDQLTALPESLGQFTQLQSLNLTGNRLTALPESLGQLTQLQELYLGDNQLTALPESLGQLTQLQSLNLSRNRLTALPESLGQLTQMQELYLGDNQLTALPESLGQLTQLQELYVHNNRLTVLPEGLAQLTQLRILDLRNNHLTAMSESIGQLTRLQRLILYGNQLTALPESFGQLTRLETLDLDRNKLTALPEQFRQLRQLKLLFLHGNPALGLPPEILGPTWQETTEERKAAAPQAILDYYFRKQREATRRLNEAKMLIVGQGGVGKTSLVHYLINHEKCDPKELPTEGINIKDWPVQGSKDADARFQEVNTHIWDFGGQEIMHATHQFFLTRRSLYLLVIDARAGEKESNIHYWLKIIGSYGGASPVLVVLNKCDQHPHDLNETALRRDYPNICGFVQTSCETGAGIAELREAIGKQIWLLPNVFDELPMSYFQVKKDLEREAKDKNYIRIEEYHRICASHGVNEQKDQEQLIRFLHDLGVVLNFQDPDDPYGQNDPFVLNPEWVTEGVYAIVNDKPLKAQKDGVLAQATLAGLLNALKEPARLHRAQNEAVRTGLRA
jgi:small GTP-binding protein